MAKLPARRGALLDLTAAIGIAGPIVLLFQGLSFRPVLLSAGSALAIVLTVGAWVWWRCSRGSGRSAAVVLAFSATVVVALGEGPLSFGATWIASLSLAGAFGARAAIGYAVTLTATAATIHFFLGNPLPRIVAEAVGTAIFVGFGAAFALVLRDAEQVDAERAELLSANERALAALELANQELERSNAELERRLGSEQDLVLAQERERTARELHDGLGHRLTAIGLSLDFAERARDSTPERAHEEIIRARVATSEALGAMRRVVRAMNPIETSTARGADAFEAIASAFGSTGLEVQVAVTGDHPLGHEHTLLLLRFVQEGLTNVVRHTTADRVELNIHSDTAAVSASLRDFGGKAAIVGSFGGPGFGIRSLGARAEAMGGSLTAAPNDTGFELRITLPSHEDTPPADVLSRARAVVA